MKLLKLTTKNGIEFQSQERMNNFFWAGRLIILYLIIAAFDIQIIPLFKSLLQCLFLGLKIHPQNTSSPLIKICSVEEPLYKSLSLNVI